MKNEDCNGPSPSIETQETTLRSELSHLTISPEQIGENSRSTSVLRAIELPLPVASRKMVSHIRAAAHFHMPNPTKLTDVDDIRDSLRIAHGRKDFLDYKSGSYDAERSLVFAKLSNLGFAEDSQRWYSEGTFSTSPDFFKSNLYNSR